MRVPVIQGIIRRRLLVNFRVEAQVMKNWLPAPFRPKLHNGFAIAGICLIRLEQIRPRWVPKFLGHSSENAAHRVAVEWTDDSGESRSGVFVPRRDTNSRLNCWAGGRLFPGQQNRADFEVVERGSQIALTIRSRDGVVSVRVSGREVTHFPRTSCFESLAVASRYFEEGGTGYSPGKDCCRLEGMELRTRSWKVQPLEVEQVESSFFAAGVQFPAGSVTFDHALIMRDIPHEWHDLPDLKTGAPWPAPAPAQS